MSKFNYKPLLAWALLVLSGVGFLPSPLPKVLWAALWLVTAAVWAWILKPPKSILATYSLAAMAFFIPLPLKSAWPIVVRVGLAMAPWLVLLTGTLFLFDDTPHHSGQHRQEERTE